MANPDQLSRYIRFQLAELRARNAHHEFEHLTRQFARLRISERIIPATGPVGAGGDAGRDFETYRSYLFNTPIAGSTFLARAGEKTLVFSCSLMTNIEGKIRSDVRTICPEDHNVDEIYYFCEADVPVGARNKLKEHCKEAHNVELTIIDGQGLSENLVNPDVFWVAQEYLGIPAEMYPKPSEADEHYDASREKWIAQSQTPVSFSDFSDVKAGVRRATFDPSRRADLLSWLERMNLLRDGPIVSLRKRASYEICVAALRGLNDLSSRRDLVVEYFSNLSDLRDPTQLRDATILLSYCSTAALAGHFEMDTNTLHGYTSALIRNLDARLKEDLPAGVRCSLLEIRGTAEGLWYRRGVSPELNPAGMIGFWTKMLRLVPSAPLFPLESFADILTVLAPHFAGNTKFEKLTQRTDELLEKRTSGYIAAEKCRDRAVAFLESGKVLSAIRQLHITKVKWFSAETLRGSALAILLLSDCYLRLGLVYASKYYSAAAVALVGASTEDDIKRLIAGAVRAHFDACYAGGEWFTAATLAGLVFAACNGFDPDAYNLDGEGGLREVTYHLSLMRAITRKLAPQSLTAAITREGDDWPISDDFREIIDELTALAEKVWDSKDPAEIRVSMESDLFGRPFLDVGRRRTVEWRALGVRWIVSFDNERDAVAISEAFIATLQIALADLSSTDLALLPTSVRVDITVTLGEKVTTKEEPSNEEALWRVELPRSLLDAKGEQQELNSQVVALATVVLGQCSTLSQAEFHARLEAAMKAGLSGKTMVVRPYAPLFTDLLSSEDFQAGLRARFDPLFARDQFVVREATELAWKGGDGPGYSKKLSEEFIANRYARSLPPVRFTLPRLAADPVVGPRLRALRERGLKDWEILLLVMNRVARYRIDQAKPTSLEEHKRLMKDFVNSEESESAPSIPMSAFSDEDIRMQLTTGAATIAKTWQLHLYRQTPDFGALRKLLEARYHITRDDVPHDDLFQQP